jgi:hypothetical protein
MIIDKAFMGSTTQRPSEEIPYVISTAAFGDSSPTSVTAVAKDITDPAAVTAVTSTVFPVNSPSVSGTNITLSELKALTDGKKYRVIVSFLYSGAGPYERFFDVYCEAE